MWNYIKRWYENASATCKVLTLIAVISLIALFAIDYQEGKINREIEETTVETTDKSVENVVVGLEELDESTTYDFGDLIPSIENAFKKIGGLVVILIVVFLGAVVSKFFDLIRNPILDCVEWIKKKAEELIWDEPEMWVPFYISCVINVIMLVKDLMQNPF